MDPLFLEEGDYIPQIHLGIPYPEAQPLSHKWYMGGWTNGWMNR